MSHEKRIKRQLKRNLNEIPDKTDIDEADLENLVDECVTFDKSWPIYDITATEFSSRSRKPSNIKVEFDIEAALEILAQAGYLSGHPAGVFASISSLCALVSRKTKIDLEPETGFVYWVAYENQHDPWEIPEQELVELACEKSNSMDVHFDLSKKEVESRIQRLCRINSFRRELRPGEDLLILRERCSSDWS